MRRRKRRKRRACTKRDREQSKRSECFSLNTHHLLEFNSCPTTSRTIFRYGKGKGG